MVAFTMHHSGQTTQELLNSWEPRYLTSLRSVSSVTSSMKKLSISMDESCAYQCHCLFLLPLEWNYQCREFNKKKEKIAW